ncbi:MAG: tRNA dihydrouridine synthase DusB [Planctomycetota bacterium]
MSIGSLTLETNLLLAPLAGYTDLAFRLCCREQGGVGLATTEIVSAEALIRDTRQTPRYLVTTAADSPLSVQIDGSSAEALIAAVKKLEDRGAVLVDINMGCPVQRITSKGGGSSWTRSPKQTAERIGRVVEAASIPITCKTRLGWDADQITAPDLARALEDVGVAALTIHGRTREQGFSGRACLEGIRDVVQATRSMPVIGNGDVLTPQDAKRMIEITGCQGVAIGRGALGDPWIFQRTDHYLRTGVLPPPPAFAERVKLVRQHALHLMELFGERHGVIRFRKAGIRYSGVLGLTKVYRREVSFAKDRAALLAVLDRVADGVYQRPSPRRARGVVAPPEPVSIPLPKGPVEKW